jgi:hypothetical protein
MKVIFPLLSMHLSFHSLTFCKNISEGNGMKIIASKSFYGIIKRNNGFENLFKISYNEGGLVSSHTSV